MKVLIVVNPKSGYKSSKDHLLDALSVFSKYGYVVEMYITQAQNDAYNHVLKCKTKYDIVTVFGGDGTMNEVTNALMKKSYKPKIGYFPSGTQNDFGTNFNLGSNFVEIAERICAGKSMKFDVGQFNDKYFNYVAAFGAFCDVPYSTQRKAKEALGNFAYIIEGMTKIKDIKPTPVTVKIKNKTHKYSALFGLVFSGTRVAGIQILDSKKGKIDDGKFNILIVDYVKTPLIEMPSLVDILANQEKHFHWYSTNEVEMTFENGAIWTIDGEEAKIKDIVKITNHNKALEMLY